MTVFEVAFEGDFIKLQKGRSYLNIAVCHLKKILKNSYPTMKDFLKLKVAKSYHSIPTQEN